MISENIKKFESYVPLGVDFSKKILSQSKNGIFISCFSDSISLLSNGEQLDRSFLQMAIAKAFNFFIAKQYDKFLLQIDVIENAYRFPFVLNDLIDFILLNFSTLLEKSERSILKRVIYNLIKYENCFIRLKVFRFDNYQLFQSFREQFYEILDLEYFNKQRMFFITYLAYPDIKEKYLDMLVIADLDYGKNDESYFACVARLKNHFDSSFQAELCMKLIKANKLELALLFFEFSDKKTQEVILSNIENNYSNSRPMLSRLLIDLTAVENPLLNSIKIEKPKVAICISGQLRGYKQTFKFINDFFAQYFDFDVYINVWADVGCREPYPLTASDRVFSGEFLASFKAAISGGKISWQEFVAQYPSVCKLTSTENNVDEEFIRSSFSNANNISIQIEKFSNSSLVSNQHKMFYKIQKCFDMIPDENEYDLVFRMRPDRIPKIKSADIVWPDILNICSQKGHIFIDEGYYFHEFKGFVIGDTFAFSSYENMKVYSCFYSDYVDGLGVVRAHVDFALYLYSKGFRALLSPVNFGKFLNPLIENEDILMALRSDSEHRNYPLDSVLLDAVEKDLLDVLN